MAELHVHNVGKCALFHVVIPVVRETHAVAAAAGGMLPGNTIATHSLWLQYNSYSAESLLVIVLATFWYPCCSS